MAEIAQALDPPQGRPLRGFDHLYAAAGAFDHQAQIARATHGGLGLSQGRKYQKAKGDEGGIFH